ncbi:transcription factor domain-containing protein [Aspergillus mulundensis]|uniref:Putative Zn(II)2Cys6 transcription factor n=1 Tax=Aspergillus mulundensis TaxID=1810919 RepID=A0A3D8RFU6_9EURO|nr:putative Zn(II)2Cys6 transcription factor [Aspergillus mulundensis]RDW72744.1 putative Zn(II)2Cys6 transcription factor [Aspergillus mulundensis]
MLAPHSPAAGVRKGTKSCTECRRRKVRCVRIPEDAPTCRQCTERNTACLAQTSSSRPRQAQRLPSRYRIAQLESQVSRLTKAVNNIEVRLGGNPSIQVDQTVTHSPGSEESDAESTASEILIAEEPSQLRSLFQNDWLSVDTQRRKDQLQERRMKASAHLAESVRPALQKLIPTKEQTAEMLVCTYDWMQMVHTMLPQPSVPNSSQEMLQHYEEMCQPDVDIIVLASWLLTLAITAQQIPQSGNSPDTPSMGSHKRISFARSVSDAVESLVMTHDRLIGTYQGLGMCIHFIRLQMGRGNPQKGWLKMRHLIALAELMGLPKAVQLARVKKANSPAEQAAQHEKIQLWELICTIDRLGGLLINLPPYTRRYQLKVVDDLVVDGVVQPSVYMSRLMDISPKIYDLEDLSATEGSTTKLYTSALEIVRGARDLASEAPASWWTINMTDDLRPDHVVQYMHYCIVMKAHLPVALRQDRTEEYLYSRLACIDACECVAHRYHFLRRKLPSGFFTLRMLDLQAFGAMAALLLLSHTCPFPDHRTFQIDKPRIEGLVTQIIELMEEKSKDGVGVDFAERGAKTLRSLRNLLQQDASNPAPMQELTVNVPLLGNIHIRRNVPATQTAPPESQRSSAVPQSTSWQPQEQTLPAHYNPQFATSTYVQEPLLPSQAVSNMQWEPLSWSVEDAGENLLEDAMMAESFDQATMWHNMYYNTFG